MKRTPVRTKRRGGPRRGPVGIPPEQWRNPKYLKFLRANGWCFVCGLQWPLLECPKGVCDPAHGPTNGMRSKGPDSGAIPMCRTHHGQQHDMGWPRFERWHGFRREVAAAYWWRRFCDQEGIAQKEETCKS